MAMTKPKERRPDRLVEALRAKAGLTHDELAERTGLTSRHVLFLLYRLEADGRVGHEANRWYPSA
jgi:predicted ArsR family transcriptional regulator